MADPRTFTLIGEFKDGITPELAKINDQLNRLKSSFSGIGSRKNTGFRGATNDIGKLISAHKNLSQSIKDVESDLRSTLGTLKQYRSEMGKAARATHAFQKAGGNLGSSQFTKNMEASNRAAQDYLRTLKQISQESRRAYSGGGGGFRNRPPRPPSPPSGGGMGGEGRAPRTKGGGGGGMSAHMGEFGFAYTLGFGISQPIQNAIVTGFQIGVGLMTKPFQYFASNFQERMQDEMSDLKAAGGLFSIAKEQKGGGFIRTFQDAVEFTQENNRIMDRMAATLPGTTEDYVQVSKRLSDSVARIIANDPKKAALYAEELRQKEPQYFKEMTGPITKMTGQEQQQASIQAILANLTKQTVLAGMGGGGGPQGAMGAYGLPQLSERMLTETQVSLGQFQRYAAIFRDPMIMQALQKEIPNINKTAANSVERAKALDGLFKRVLPEELIERYRRTMAGITEGFRTALVGKESGLFGLGRPLQIAVEQFDDFGNLLKDANGKVKKANVGLYNFVRDILANLGQVFMPIVENLQMMFDPLTEIGKKLQQARLFTYKLLQSFNFYKGGFEDLGFEGGQRDLRASLAVIANLLRFVGALDVKGFEDIMSQIKSKDLDFGAMMKNLLDRLLNSEAAAGLGRTIGDVIGTVLTHVAGVTGFISGRIASSNKLFDGLKKGFEKAGGPAALSNIFQDVLKSMLKVLLSIGKVIPLQGYVIAGLALVLPAIAQGLGMKIGELTLGLLEKIAGMFKIASTPAIGQMRDAIKSFFMRLVDFFRTRFAKDLSIQQVTVRDLGATPPKGLPSGKQQLALPPAGALALSKSVPGMTAFAKFMRYVQGIGPRFMNFFKGLLGKFTIFGGVLTSIISLFQGKDLAQSLADGAGPVLGAALGAALVPFLGPIGPMIGSLIGGWIGSLKVVTDPLTEIFSAVGGAVQGLFDSVMMVGTLIGDVVGELFGMVAGVAGVNGQLDILKILLAPVTLALQALELGLKGFALLLAEMRVFFKRYFGTSEEYQGAIKERDKMNASLKESQGRINAYNASMLGTEHLQKQVNDAQYELVRGGKKLTEARKKELVSFIEAARRLDKEIVLKKQVTVSTAAAPAPTAPPVAQAPKVSFGENLTAAFNQQVAQLKDAIVKLPENLAFAAGFAYEKIQQVGQWLQSLPGKLNAAAAQAIAGLQAAWQRIVSWFYSLPGKFSGAASSVSTSLNSGTNRIVNAIVNWARSLPGKIATAFIAGRTAATNPPAKPKAFGHSGVMPLNTAIATEMRNKPPGSHLVIANSSETVIPAAGGYGTKAFMDILSSGFQAVSNQYKSLAEGLNNLDKQSDQRTQQTNTQITDYHSETKAQISQISQNLVALASKVTELSSIGGGMGMGLGGGYGSAGMQIAGQLGNFIKATGGAPGSIHEHPMHGGVKGRHAPGSYHYSGRAIDIGAYAGEQAGVIARIQAFNARYGVRPVEFLHAGNDPNHQDHVHVAYATGYPTMFRTREEAMAWEKKATLGNVPISSITARQGEFGGGKGITLNAPISITQQPGQDSEELAAIVAMKIGDALGHVLAANGYGA